MPFGTDDSQSAGFFNARPQLDIRTTTGHIGCNRHGTGHTSFCNDLCLPGSAVWRLIRYAVFFLPAASCQAVRLTATSVVPTSEGLPSERSLSISSMTALYFSRLRLENQVLMVLTDSLHIRGDRHHIQFVDIP